MLGTSRGCCNDLLLRRSHNAAPGPDRPMTALPNHARPIHLVACVLQKGDRRARAADLYCSDWFRRARLYVEQNRHTLVHLFGRARAYQAQTALRSLGRHLARHNGRAATSMGREDGSAFVPRDRTFPVRSARIVADVSQPPRAYDRLSAFIVLLSEALDLTSCDGGATADSFRSLFLPRPCVPSTSAAPLSSQPSGVPEESPSAPSCRALADGGRGTPTSGAREER